MQRRIPGERCGLISGCHGLAPRNRKGSQSVTRKERDPSHVNKGSAKEDVAPSTPTVPTVERGDASLHFRLDLTSGGGVSEANLRR